MRRITFVAALFLAGCATAPQQPVVAPPVVVTPVQQVPTVLVGLTAAQLVQRFGSPTLQIQEGVGTKLQFRSERCVLDAYLYPQAAQPPRVTYVDARLRNGAPTDQAGCISALSAR